jgi:hypothetical protein
MVFLLILIGVAVAFALWFFAPKGIAVHAAISEGKELPAPRFPLAGFFRDSAGRNIDWESHMPARAFGNSCKDYGIADGDVVIVRLLDDAGRRNLKADDLIVINSPVDEGQTGIAKHPFRFRKIKSVNGPSVDFFPAPGRDVKSQSIEYAHSIVEFLPNSR